MHRTSWLWLLCSACQVSVGVATDPVPSLERARTVSAALSAPLAPMSTARAGGAIASLPNGRLLVAGGNTNGSGVTCTDATELYDPAANAWTPAGKLSISRCDFPWVTLPNGDVLLLGGYSPQSISYGYVQSVERFNAATGTWSVSGQLLAPRGYHTATLLPDGRVLIAGGIAVSGSSSLITASAELYDPSTNTSVQAAPMLVAHALHVAAPLPDGRVLIAGGWSSSTTTASAELFDPSGAGWSSAPAMSVPRVSPTATVLSNGQVLVAGGMGQSSAQLFDPPSGSWLSAGSMHTTRGNHFALATSYGALLFGGEDSGHLASVERFDLASRSFQLATPMSVPRDAAMVAPVFGKYLAAGGYGTSSYQASVELWDDDGATCTPTTCAQQGKNCGTIVDGCGDNLGCGSCASGSTCTNNICVTNPDAGTSSSCSHPVSVTGAALTSGCSSCATTVCGKDSYCCSVAWDSICVSEAASWCGGTTTTPSCHSECTTGTKLASSCDGCAATVCAKDGYCCATYWDSICVSEAKSWCPLSCP